MADHTALEYVVVIPVRLASTRLPEKPLIEIKGVSILRRTYLQCAKAVPEARIYVATDDIKIKQHCDAHDMQVVLTSAECLTGTDRVAEFAEHIPADIYINVQGDEPLISPQDIKDVIAAAQQYPGEIINGAAPIEDEDQYRSPTIPKVVYRPDGRLLYMSRTGIPGNKQNRFVKSWRQICVYAFTKTALQAFKAHGQKTELEEQEDIEILRFLELGYEVRMIPLSDESIAVDTPEDIQKVVNKL